MAAIVCILLISVLLLMNKCLRSGKGLLCDKGKYSDLN